MKIHREFWVNRPRPGILDKSLHLVPRWRLRHVLI